MTEDQYKLAHAKLQQAIDNLLQAWDGMATAARTAEAARSEELLNHLNTLADMMPDVERAKRNLEDEWSTRDWTPQDFASWKLVQDNID